jgi:hypothetical protein
VQTLAPSASGDWSPPPSLSPPLDEELVEVKPPLDEPPVEDIGAPTEPPEEPENAPVAEPAAAPPVVAAGDPASAP